MYGGLGGGCQGILSGLLNITVFEGPTGVNAIVYWGDTGTFWGVTGLLGCYRGLLGFYRDLLGCYRGLACVTWAYRGLWVVSHL